MVVPNAGSVILVLQLPLQASPLGSRNSLGTPPFQLQDVPHKNDQGKSVKEHRVLPGPQQTRANAAAAAERRAPAAIRRSHEPGGAAEAAAPKDAEGAARRPLWINY